MKALFPVVIDFSPLISPLLSAAKIIILTAAILIYQALKPWWVLPESEMDRCRRNVTAQLRLEAEPVATSRLSQETKEALMVYYQNELERRLRQLCGIKNDRDD